MAGDLPLVLVVGGGELGSAVCHRLARSGLGVIVTDLAEPRCLRRNVCFATALVGGKKEVEGVRGVWAAGVEEARDLIDEGTVAVMSGDFTRLAADLEPDVLIDARMLKNGEGISRDMAPLVIGLGPGFAAGGNTDIVIETERGHDLGRVINRGSAHPDTGRPGEITGFSEERVIRAPKSGRFRSGVALGSLVCKGDVVGYVEEAAVRAPIDGLVRGLIADGLQVREGAKMGDVDPRGSAIDPCTISDRGRSVAGGVLEAVMTWWTAKR
jgi:xanthine dehydrogenase accessory factor